MSTLAADILIWILLAGGVGFGVLGYVGLLIFPDVKSRMFTASRATLISVSLVTLAVIIFGINGFLGSGGDLYTALVIHTLFLFGVLAIANVFIYRIILEQIPLPNFCRDESGENKPAGRNKE
ncbi:MAG: monovalent cation/H(+) antiporter subunit G [Methanoregula sp.]|jgi:multicomponent Na+:H+ antiporter subunit G|uniref:monovalent cation/H(+) antiporter subunit G n=1 Tax=Methanoregula sp. TaxID=2052170 RepID=UPI003C18C2DE